MTYVYNYGKVNIGVVDNIECVLTQSKYNPLSII